MAQTEDEYGPDPDGQEAAEIKNDLAFFFIGYDEARITKAFKTLRAAMRYLRDFANYPNANTRTRDIELPTEDAIQTVLCASGVLREEISSAMEDLTMIHVKMRAKEMFPD